MTVKPKKRMRRGDTVGRIYDSIRSRIISMTLSPGAVIDEGEIVREFRVSRTPVREALVRLASEGLIILLPNKGSQVTTIDVARVRDYLEASDFVQPFVTALAARRRTELNIAEIEEAAMAFEKAARTQDGERMAIHNRDFHAAIARSCGNPSAS